MQSALGSASGTFLRSLFPARINTVIHSGYKYGRGCSLRFIKVHIFSHWIADMGLRDASMTMFVAHQKAVLCAVGIGLVSATLCVGFRYFRRPKKVRQVGLVSQINVFPLKSGKGLSVTTAQCLEMGLKYGELKDRWVFNIIFVFSINHVYSRQGKARQVYFYITRKAMCFTKAEEYS